MATNVKDLCRLCAGKDSFSKDLLDESNKNVLKMIQDVIQIFIFENDNMPTKICLNCEDKMVSFQLYILECYKAQDTLRKLYADSLKYLDTVKLEEENGPVIKSEVLVKDEMTADEIVSALKNEEALAEIGIYDDDILEDDDEHIDENNDSDDLDNVAIATLKQIKSKEIRKKVESKKDMSKLEDLLKSANFKLKDIVDFECMICEERSSNWNSLQHHYETNHKYMEPLVICLCGYQIKSKAVLYKHVSDHRNESRKLNKNEDSGDEKLEQYYAKPNIKELIRFICHNCNKECSSWYSLQAHTERHHKTAPFVKCNCGVILKSKSVMYKHVQDHRSPNVLACDKCPRITKTIEALNKHKMRHVPKSERRFNCRSCDKYFTSLDAVKSHERSHIPIEDRKIYHCEICNVKFTTRASCMSHKRVVHDKIKGYVCDLCGYACGTGGELRQHRAIHSDNKPFACRKCPKAFKTYSNLKTHMDTHEDTSYECYICRRILNSRRTLRKHLLVHEDMCRHVCSYCNKAFKRRQTLKVHMYTHTGDKPLSCKWCDERFAYASTLRSHRLRCHPDKMTSQAQTSYQNFPHINMTQENFIKNDAEVVSVAIAVKQV